MTLHDIESMDKEFLLPAEVAKHTGFDAQSIRIQAQDDPNVLGFNVIVCGTRALIPRLAYIDFCRRTRDKMSDAERERVEALK